MKQAKKEELATEMVMLMSAVAPMNTRIKEIKAELNPDMVDGERIMLPLHELLAVDSNRDKVGWKSIAERMKPSRQLVTANTTHTVVRSIKVTQRQGT